MGHCPKFSRFSILTPPLSLSVCRVPPSVSVCDSQMLVSLSVQCVPPPKNMVSSSLKDGFDLAHSTWISSVALPAELVQLFIYKEVFHCAIIWLYNYMLIYFFIYLFIFIIFIIFFIKFKPKPEMKSSIYDNTSCDKCQLSDDLHGVRTYLIMQLFNYLIMLILNYSIVWLLTYLSI